MKLSIFTESPDTININGKVYDYNEKAFVAWVFLKFRDTVDDKNTLLAFNPKSNNFVSSNSIVADELNDPQKHQRELELRNDAEMTVNPVKDILHNIKHMLPIHNDMLYMCQLSGRARSSDTRSDLMISGRIYYIRGVYYITFWDQLLQLASHINELLSFISNELSIDIKSAKFQFKGFAPSSFITYETVRYVMKNPPKQANTSASNMERDLHVKKALIAKKFLQALQTMPRTKVDLQAALEREFQMPFVKLKAIFPNLPLGEFAKQKLARIIQSN